MSKTALIFVGRGGLVEFSETDRLAWNATFRAAGLRWDWSPDTYAELIRFGGPRKLVDRYADFIGATIDAEPLERAHDRLLAAQLSEGIALRRGVDQVLGWSHRAGAALGLVSRARAGELHALLAATARARGGREFDLILSHEDMVRPAPHPDGVEQALDALDVTPDRALAIADTPASAAAAMDAGLAVIAFPGRFVEEQIFPAGVHQVTGLSGDILSRHFPEFPDARVEAAE